MTNTTPPKSPQGRRLSLVVSDPGESSAPPFRPDAFGNLLIDGLCLHVEGFYLRQFLNDILAEPDLRQILTTPVRADGRTVRLLIQAVQPIAEEAQRIASEYTGESEAAFVAAILYGIDYCFYPALRGKYDAADALATIVHPALRRLDRNAPQTAAVLRTCMRWGSFDEEEVFTDWLVDRMQHALEVLKLALF